MSTASRIVLGIVVATLVGTFLVGAALPCINESNQMRSWVEIEMKGGGCKGQAYVVLGKTDNEWNLDHWTQVGIYDTIASA